MATILNQATGAIVNVDLRRHGQFIPAALPTEYVQDGLPATDQRDEGATSVECEIVLSRIPGVGDDATTVLDFIQEAALQSDRLTIAEDGMPTVTECMIGDRGIDSARVTTSRIISLTLSQVRVIRPSRAPISLPEPAAGASSNGAPQASGGAQSPGGDSSILYEFLRRGG